MPDTHTPGPSGPTFHRAFAAAPALALLALAAGLAASAFNFSTAARGIWLAGLVACGTPVVVRTAVRVATGNLASDVVASLAIIGSVVFAQPLAGLIVVLMQTGGEALERYAAGRASSALRLLEDAAPRTAHRVAGDAIADVPVAAVRTGDVILIRPGEMLPCDSEVVSGQSMIDTSPITGEPLPLTATTGTKLLSGMLNLDGSLTARALAPADASQYARIVELVRSAASTKAPLQRLADRYAGWFTPFVIVICLVAWMISGDSARVLAVLVVATPCPLILAAPVAFVGGINQAAARHIVVRNGTAIERLASVDTAVFDKTGTLTLGHPAVASIKAWPPFTEDEVLALAASVEQHSGHALASPVVDAARARDLALVAPENIREEAGRGVSGIVNGREVAVGSRPFISGVLSQSKDAAREWPEWRVASASAGVTPALTAWVSIDGAIAGRITWADQLREGAREMLQRISSIGIHRTIVLSGDDSGVVEAVARSLRISKARGELLPEQKVAEVQALTAAGHVVLMVGDGTNDAPALRTAAVGVVLGGHGGGISAEAADVVILNDDLKNVATAIQISRRTMQIARQSILVGLSLSMIGMLVAAAGFLAPVPGALVQEAIDVAVILNALRAAVPGRSSAAVGDHPAAGELIPVPRPST